MGEEEKQGAPQDAQERRVEAERVVKRLTGLIHEHVEAALPLGIQLDKDDLRSVISALRDHANGGVGTPVPGGRDEIHSHVLDRLFEELVDEPSNILFSKLGATGTQVSGYDAMDKAFWLECLEVMEKEISDD